MSLVKTKGGNCKLKKVLLDGGSRSTMHDFLQLRKVHARLDMDFKKRFRAHMDFAKLCGQRDLRPSSIRIFNVLLSKNNGGFVNFKKFY